MPDWLSYILPFGGGLFQGLFNLFSQNETNETNLRIARETNAANAEQANLAYLRSMPTNQVQNLMSAGMSKPAALSSLSGGGTYTAPVMNSAHMDAPQLDLSAAFDRLENIPSNVEQRRLVQAQRHDIEVATNIKENQEKRQEELHQYEIWQRQYGRQTATMLDAADSTIMNALLDSGKEINDFKSYESLVRALGLQDSKELRNLPSVARQQVFNNVKDKFAEYREQREQQNRNTAAQDAHDLAILRKQIERINVKYYDKEKHESLLNLMRVGEGLIQDNNIKFAELQAQNMENYVREAGIDDEAQAQALAAYAERLANDDEAMQQVYQYDLNHGNEVGSLARRGLRQALRDFGQLLKTLHFSAGKYSVNKRTQITRQ